MARGVLAGLAAAILLLAAPARAQTIEFAGTLSPPFLAMRNGIAVGLTVDYGYDIANRAGISISDFAIVNVARMYYLIAHQPNVCGLTIPRVPARETDYAWVAETGRFVASLWMRADDPRPVAGFADLAGFDIALPLGSALAPLLKQRDVAYRELPDHDLLMKNLAVRRVDAVALNYPSAVAMARAEKLGVREAFRFLDIPYFLACNKDLPAGLIERLRDANAAAKRDMLLQRLHDSYGLGDIYPVVAPRS
jgi:ABC-type amino acid transport substrate-binding protein